MRMENDELKNRLPEEVTSQKVLSLIGVAKGAEEVDWEKERLKYLLSK